MNGLKIETEGVEVVVFTETLEVKGTIHTKKGGYSGRVSDMLNVGKLAFIPVTQAEYRKKGSKGAWKKTECLLVGVAGVEALEIV